MLLVAGGMLRWFGSFMPLFTFAGVMQPLAWIAIRALVGKNITQIDLDKGLRTAQSPALLAMGLGLMAVGAALAALVFTSWSYILSVTKSSVAAAAAILLALMALRWSTRGAKCGSVPPVRWRDHGASAFRKASRWEPHTAGSEWVPWPRVSSLVGIST